jgi:hypothetical protein
MTDNERDEEQTSRFKVDDRRKFTSEGDPVKSEAGTPPPPVQERSPEPPERREGQKSGQAKEPTIDFASFIMSLAASAMAYLGEVADPSTGQRMENLEGAQQMIEILTMLQTKTTGNLEPDEKQLLESLLYELRMKFLTKRNLIKL